MSYLNVDDLEKRGVFDFDTALEVLKTHNFTPSKIREFYADMKLAFETRGDGSANVEYIYRGLRRLVGCSENVVCDFWENEVLTLKEAVEDRFGDMLGTLIFDSGETEEAEEAKPLEPPMSEDKEVEAKIQEIANNVVEQLVKEIKVSEFAQKGSELVRQKAVEAGLSDKHIDRASGLYEMALDEVVRRYMQLKPQKEGEQ